MQQFRRTELLQAMELRKQHLGKAFSAQVELVVRAELQHRPVETLQVVALDGLPGATVQHL
jgi:hypothetical protein